MKKSLSFLTFALLILFLVSCGVQKSSLKDFQFTEVGDSFEISGYNETLKDSVILPEVFNGKPVIKIARDAFRASNLKQVIIPASYEIIEEGAFLSSLKLEKVTFVNNSKLIEIGNNSFWGNKSLKSITIPKSVKRIGELAFYDTPNLKEIKFAEDSQLETIDNSAFAKASSLKEINIPRKVKTIGESVFSQNYSLININVDSLNPYYSSLDGVLYNKNKTKLISYPAGKKNEKIIINENVKEISNNAFYHSQHLKRVVLNEGVLKIGKYAFSSIKELQSIIIPLSVKEIGLKTFNGSLNLKIFTIYEEVPNTWHSKWNSSNLEVYLNNSWDYDLNNNPQPK